MQRSLPIAQQAWGGSSKKPQSVQDWNVEFRKCIAFFHPHHNVRCGRRPISQLFMKFPNAKDQITAFGLGNLMVLTAELVHTCCVEELFPKVFKQWCDDIGKSTSSVNSTSLTQEMFLKEHSISNFSIPTCWRWMRQLGFTYSMHIKLYDVDVQRRKIARFQLASLVVCKSVGDTHLKRQRNTTLLADAGKTSRCIFVFFLRCGERYCKSITVVDSKHNLPDQMKERCSGYACEETNIRVGATCQIPKTAIDTDLRHD